MPGTERFAELERVCMVGGKNPSCFIHYITSVLPTIFVLSLFKYSQITRSILFLLFLKGSNWITLEMDELDPPSPRIHSEMNCIILPCLPPQTESENNWVDFPSQLKAQ